MALITLNAHAQTASDSHQNEKLKPPSTFNRNLYPPEADAKAEIAAALRQAQKDSKNVLLDFGATWCFDCHVLDNALHRPDLKSIVDENYLVVHVDVGQFDKNLDLCRKYDVPIEKGIPALAVLDNSGKLLFSQKSGQFESARSLTVNDVSAFLTKWKPSKTGSVGNK